jgi:hypothetical protein
VVVAVVDLQVRLYLECGHAVVEPPRREWFKPGEALHLEFGAQRRTCERCWPPLGS